MRFTFLFKQIALFGALFGVSGGVTYYMCYANYNPQQSSQTSYNPNDETPLKPAEVLLSSMTSLKKFNIDADIEFTYQKDMKHGYIDIQGVADVSDLSNLKISGDILASYGATQINGKLGYFDETIYLDYNQSYLKLEQAELFEFVDILPSMGINISIPNELKNLNLGEIATQLGSMEPVICPDGYMFEFAINDAISLFFKSDFEYNFIGLKTNEFFYDDLFVFLDCDISDENVSDGELINPEKRENAPIYQSFRPALNLINGFYNLLNSPTNSLTMNIKLDKQGLNQVEPVIELNSDVSFDLEQKSISLKSKIKENNREHLFDLYLLNDVLYINQANINKISIHSQSIINAINYLLNQISDDVLKDFIDSLVLTMNDNNLSNIVGNLQNLNNWIESIDILEDKVSLTFDLSVFGLDINKITIDFSLDYQTILGIYLNNFEYNGYLVNLSISTKEYNLIIPNVNEYAAIDPALNLLPTIFNLTKQEQFRLEFSGNISSLSEQTPPITIDGGFQFDTKKYYGYGQATIVDSSSYSHNIKIDLREEKNLLFVYNDKLKGRMDGAAIDDVSTMIKDLINNKDDHFIQLFGDILEKVYQTPLYQALNGDIGILFATDTFSNIEVSDTTIDLDLSGALVGLDCLMHIRINYDTNNLYGMEISNIIFNNSNASFSINLKQFDNSLESSRLDPMDTYFNFSDLKLLLSLGINTAIYDDYHFTGTVNLNIASIFNKSLPIDLKIKNNAGDVSLSLDIEDVPIITFINDDPDYVTTSSRNTSIYYKDGLVYLKRTDRVVSGISWNGLVYKDINYSCVCEINYFLDNIMYYLSDFVLGFRSSISEMIQGIEINPTGQIKYENILKKFIYNKEKQYFYIDIDIAELAKNEDLQSLTLQINVDEASATLKSLDVYLNISASIITIAISANLNLIDLGNSVDLSSMDSFILEHQSDERNIINKTIINV